MKASLFLAIISLAILVQEARGQWGGVQSRAPLGFTLRPSATQPTCQQPLQPSRTTQSPGCVTPRSSSSSGCLAPAPQTAPTSTSVSQTEIVFRGASQEYDFDPLRGRGKLFPLPKTSDARINSILAADRTVFYKLRRAYQNFVPQDRSVGQIAQQAQQFAVYFSSVNAAINGGDEFPWEATFGLNASVSEAGGAARYPVLDALWIPPGRRIVLLGGRLEEQGDRLFLALDGDRPVQWIFPQGTVAMEIGYVRDTDAGRLVPFEVRTREKKNGDWTVARYAPFGTRQDFERKAGINRAGDAKRLASRFFSARNIRETEIFYGEDLLEELPELPADNVRAVLSQPFEDVTNVAFSAETSIPTTEAEFSAVPRHYMLGIIGGIRMQNCASCHAVTGAAVARLDRNEPSVRSNADKAGLIRGFDGVVSWHPFRVDSISDSEIDRPLNRVELRASDFDRRLVEVAREGREYPQNRLFRDGATQLTGWELPPERFLHPQTRVAGK